jgi:DNA polymerase-1
MANLSKDELLIKDFKEGLDIHSATASRILDKNISEVTKEERSMGKTVNFAIFLDKHKSLSSMHGIKKETAQKYIDEYLKMTKELKGK